MVNSLNNCRRIKFCNMLHELVCSVISHSISIIDNQRVSIYLRCNNWVNFCMIYPNIIKG